MKAALLLLGLLLTTACGPGAHGARAPAALHEAAIATGPAEAVVQVQVDAYNRGDLEAFVETYAPDVRIYDHPDRLLISGADQLRERYGALFGGAPDLHATIYQRMVRGAFVIDHETVTGRPDGGTIQAVAIYEVRNGRIQNVWFIR